MLLILHRLYFYNSTAIVKSRPKERITLVKYKIEKHLLLESTIFHCERVFIVMLTGGGREVV